MDELNSVRKEVKLSFLSTFHKKIDLFLQSKHDSSLFIKVVKFIIFFSKNQII